MSGPKSLMIPKAIPKDDSEMSIEDVAKISSVIEDDDDDTRNVFVIDDDWDDGPADGRNYHRGEE